MPSIFIEDFAQTTEIESVQPLVANATELLSISTQLAAMNNVTPLAKFTLKLPVNETDYDYEIKLKDGRMFKQKLRPNGSVEECAMTFNVTSFWKLKEFTPHRALRDLCISVILQYSVTKLVVTFA